MKAATDLRKAAMSKGKKDRLGLAVSEHSERLVRRKI